MQSNRLPNAPANATPNGTIMIGKHEFPLFRGYHRDVVRAAARLADKKPDYLREG